MRHAFALRFMEFLDTNDFRVEWIPLNHAIWEEIGGLRLARCVVPLTLEIRGCFLITLPAR